MRTAEHYRDVLGFTISGYFGTPPVFAMVERDGVEIHFNRAASGVIPRTGRSPEAYDVYLHVDGLDALAAELRTRGADIVVGPVTRVYEMREMVVRDLNGLVIALGEAPQG